MKLLKCVLLLAGIFLCCGNMLVAFLGFFYHFLLDICIDRGDMGFLSIVLMSASRSCCPFSRFIHAWSPEQGRWVWEGGVRVSPSILSSEGWDESWKWLSCLLWKLERWTASSHDWVASSPNSIFLFCCCVCLFLLCLFLLVLFGFLELALYLLVGVLDNPAMAGRWWDLLAVSWVLSVALQGSEESFSWEIESRAW